MASEMVERCKARCREKEPLITASLSPHALEELVIATIEAMREPSEKMVAEDTIQVVVGCCGMRPEHAREAWDQMIDAALTE